jgi:hypothetical protein
MRRVERVKPDRSVIAEFAVHWIKAAPLRSAAARLPRRALPWGGPPGASRAHGRSLPQISTPHQVSIAGVLCTVVSSSAGVVQLTAAASMTPLDGAHNRTIVSPLTRHGPVGWVRSWYFF